MLTSNRRYLSLILLLLVPLTFFFRNNLSQKFQGSYQHAQGESQEPNHESNATSFEHAGTLDESLEGAPRLSQVSMQFGGSFDVTYERGLRTHIRYGEKWGYPTHFLRQDIIGRGDASHGMYNKLLYLLAIMVSEHTKPFGKRSEWIAWFDADSVLLNDQIPFTVFLPPNEGEMFRDIHLLVSKDWIGFNCGVFLIRVCEWSINALNDAIALPRLRPEIDLPFNEQDSLKWVFNLPENKKHRIYQPRHWWNQYDEYYGNMGEKVMKGSIVVHFPGMGGIRPDAMGHWLDKIDHHAEEVSVPLKNTSYPTEIEAYWSRVRSAAEMLKRTEEYKNGLKDEHYEVYVADGGKIPDRLGQAERELHEIMEEEAYDKHKLREAVLKLDKAVRDAKKDVADILERKQKAEEDKRKKHDEEKQRKEEEKKKQEEEAKKKSEEMKTMKDEQTKQAMAGQGFDGPSGSDSDDTKSKSAGGSGSNSKDTDLSTDSKTQPESSSKDANKAKDNSKASGSNSEDTQVGASEDEAAKKDREAKKIALAAKQKEEEGEKEKDEGGQGQQR